jgi:hypothetical protein
MARYSNSLAICEREMTVLNNIQSEAMAATFAKADCVSTNPAQLFSAITACNHAHGEEVGAHREASGDKMV